MEGTRRHLVSSGAALAGPASSVPQRDALSADSGHVFNTFL